ncbi:single-stranded-DNA-specific exonuclease RecJ [Candidatus Roizmanbacteria bacterium CG03_land_8_20_14_0_80_35_26]|uniref:Single-stranded-DNA-specific exonuclease RecJ n=3 Tax=Candidatus Roizmaniibacteriota TaxID=1752723 RepID=A0A2M7BVS8_9BACT|nr:MAG: single-stranded-DNA-specific exonuclease RecJ [Candidatus Roizmanbacteria bacterium CG03_land_8_20_14_0_80_35_26]
MKIFFKHEIKRTDKLTSKELVDLILKHRQIKNIKEFLNPPPPLSISLLDFNPKYKLYLNKVIKLLKDIKKKDKMIVVYTDYDADGITGGAILWETLYLLGFKTMPYVPDRKKEGYGFSITGIDNIIREFNPALIISVDHGITKVKEITYAKKLGIKIIVTDHHLKSDEIPNADAIFHIPALSGSGVAYFFAKEIYQSFRSRSAGEKSSEALKQNFQTDYLALASIGTIADLVPLIGPSRSLVKHGLDIFPKVKRYGLKYILKQAGIENKKITPYEVGFIIAPRINAVGRLQHAIDALRLLCTTNEKKAFDLAYKVGQTNVERQDLVKKSVEEAKKMLTKKHPQGVNQGKPTFHPAGVNLEKIIIFVSNHWHEGIIGLIASKIADEFYRPTIVLTESSKTDLPAGRQAVIYKGSARSIPSFHITNFLRSLKKYLVDIGGHAQAAGFTIEEKKLKKFIKEAQKQGDELIKDKDLERIITADIKIPVSKINLELVKSLESLEPFGIGNPRPTFLSEGIISNAQLFGKNNNHLKIWVKDDLLLLRAKRNNLDLEIASSSTSSPSRDDIILELIAFNQREKIQELSRGQKINVVYSLEVDRWGGREKLRGRLSFIY